MSRIGCVGLLLVLLTGCSYHKRVPSGVIPKDKMESILWDMVQADRFASGYILTKKDPFEEKKEEAALFYEKVFHLHGITREEFVKSYKYYLGRPDITKVLFDSITLQAERRRDEANQRIQDSLAKLLRDSIDRLAPHADSTLGGGVDSVWRGLSSADSRPVTAEDSFRQRMKFADSALRQTRSDLLLQRLRSADSLPATAEDSFHQRIRLADSVLRQTNTDSLRPGLPDR